MRIGVLGGGQLSRMLAEAGFPANLRFTFLDPAPDACAGARGRLLVGSWDDDAALSELAGCDRVTFDFENVPGGVLEELARRATVRPAPVALAVSQDRLVEKTLFQSLGLPVPPFVKVDTRADLAAGIEHTGLPAVLKTRRMGYDGKGQAVLHQAEDLEDAWRRLGEHALIVESWVDFQFECAISAVRDASGNVRCYPLTRTWHRGGILRAASAPLTDHDLQKKAESMVLALLDHLDYVGVLTLELFVNGDELMANEFAPRVHNSAHWTIEGAATSQFENHLRAVCDWPLGDTAAAGVSMMINFIGEMPERHPFLEIPGLAWHDYDKASRPGRKVGHCTLTAPDREMMASRLPALQALLEPEFAKVLPTMLATCHPGRSKA